jgi:single-strand DNA-binding protein
MIGRLTRDVELREGSGGVKFCNFSLAVNRISKSGAEEATDFIDCTAFGKTAEFMGNWCKKGTALVVIGSLQNNNYDKDGVKHYSYKVMVREVQFAESKGSDKVETSRDAADPQTFEEVTNDDRLPF